MNEIQMINKKYIRAKRNYYIEDGLVYRAGSIVHRRRSPNYQIANVSTKKSNRLDLLVISRWIIEDFKYCQNRFNTKMQTFLLLQQTINSSWRI